jgi:hypothetical protein
MSQFDVIYQAAKTKDIATLNRLISAKAFVDIPKENGLYYETAAYRFAREGDDAAVELLRQKGANKNYIARGYAMAGNYAKAQEYRGFPPSVLTPTAPLASIMQALEPGHSPASVAITPAVVSAPPVPSVESSPATQLAKHGLHRDVNAPVSARGSKHNRDENVATEEETRTPKRRH